jgi:signal peptidase II
MHLLPAVQNYRTFYFLLAAIVLIVDQATKNIIARTIPLHDSITVIPGFFRLSHVLNPGAAFSLFADSRSPYMPWILIGFSLIVMVVVTSMLWKARTTFTLTNIGLSLILGGALGNLLDRLLLGSVIDFLAFKLGSYHWPDFNVADSAIVCGSILLMADIFFAPNLQAKSA